MIVLNFEHYWKYTPEMYPGTPSAFQYATGLSPKWAYTTRESSCRQCASWLCVSVSVCLCVCVCGLEYRRWTQIGLIMYTWMNSNYIRTLNPDTLYKFIRDNYLFNRYYFLLTSRQLVLASVCSFEALPQNIGKKFHHGLTGGSKKRYALQKNKISWQADSPNVVAMATRVGSTTFCTVPLYRPSPKTP